MTFLGFYVSGNGDIIDPLTGNVLIQNAIPRLLQQGLICNRVPLNENFDGLNRFVGFILGADECGVTTTCWIEID